jgi:hypothetical protein
VRALGAITWIVDLTRNRGVPSQSDLVCATMGAKRWSKSANASGMSTYDCKCLADALVLAGEIASGKAA